MLRLFLLSSLLLLALTAQAREVTVGVYDNDPKIFRDAQGQAAGIFVDMIREIAKREDWDLSFQDCRWSDCLALTASGEIDLMPDVAISERRQTRLDFHREPVLHSWSRVYRRAGVRGQSLLDLAGLRVAVLDGSIQQARLDVLLRELGVSHEFVPVADFRSAFDAASTGRADVAVVNHLFGDRYAHQYGLERSPVVMEPSRLFFATGKG